MLYKKPSLFKKSNQHSVLLIFLTVICLVLTCLGCGGSSTDSEGERPAEWESLVGIAIAKDNKSGGSVTLEFGSAANTSSGSSIKYNIYYAETGSWDNDTWRYNSALLDVDPVAGYTYDNAYTVNGLTNGAAYTFGVRVENGGGDEDTNTNTAFAIPTDTLPPSWDDTIGIAIAIDNETNGSVTVEFGGASDASGGSNIKYNIYYAETDSWDDDTWTNNNALLDVDTVAGSTYNNACTVTGLTNEVSYTFGVRIEDEEGNEGTNTNTALATPTELILFSDNFVADTTGNYTFSGTGSFSYDEIGKRLYVETGDSLEEEFSYTLPTLTEGAFSIDFFPVQKYQGSGSITITLKQDQNNYYQLFQSDGGDAGFLRKVVNGTEVATVSFNGEYSQGVEYQISIFFNPDKVAVSAFDEELIMDTVTSSISVNSFTVKMSQQDAYVDNIYFSNNKSYVNIGYPGNLYIQPSPDLDISATAIALKTGWGIKFVLDSGTSTEKVLIDKQYPYLGTFTDVIQAEHTLEAIIVNQNNNDVNGLFTLDMKYPVGIGGYYVAVGDSITLGVGDNFSSDDISNDGRNSGGGFQPVLNNLLTSSLGYPNTIVNEGQEGETSADGASRIASVLAAHPNATHILVLYGTNDSDIFTPVPVETFRFNMQQIIDTINAAGKKACLAKIPIALKECSWCDPYPDPSQGDKNVLWICEYNTVIDELAQDPSNNITVTPPDFYSYFEIEMNYDSEYADWLHPNGEGYHSMAQLWHNSIINN